LVHGIASAPALDFPRKFFHFSKKKFHPAGAPIVRIVDNCFGHGASPSVPLPGVGRFKQHFGAN
jgi:hypothetical protein